MSVKACQSVPIPVLGLDVSKPGEWLDLRATSACQNIEIRRSLVVKRPGQTALGASLGERVQALFDFDDGQATHFIRVGNTKVEQYNQVTNAWASVIAAPLTGTDADRVSYAFPLLSAVSF